MVVKHFLWLSILLEFIEIDFLPIIYLLFVLMRKFRLTIGHYLFAIIADSAITSIDPFLQTIVKPSLPYIDNLIRSARNKVISLSAELSSVGVRFQRVF